MYILSLCSFKDLIKIIELSWAESRFLCSCATGSLFPNFVSSCGAWKYKQKAEILSLQMRFFDEQQLIIILKLFGAWTAASSIFLSKCADPESSCGTHAPETMHLTLWYSQKTNKLLLYFQSFLPNRYCIWVWSPVKFSSLLSTKVLYENEGWKVENWIYLLNKHHVVGGVVWI